MRSVYQGVAVSFLFAVITVATLLWQIRRADLRTLATKADISMDIAAVNEEHRKERHAEILQQERARDARYRKLAAKIDNVQAEVKHNSEMIKKVVK